MLKKLLLFLLVSLLLLTSVVLFNTFTAKKWPAPSAAVKLEPLSDSSVIRMQRAVQIPTISYSDTSAIDTAAFMAFNSFLETNYPLVHQHLKKTVIRQFSYIYEWKGKDTTLAPIILMGHYDVVPVEASTLGKWTHPPFGGEVAGSMIWGRGALDDKSGVISILEAVEAELKKGFVPKQTIYCCFGHDEEISGQSAAAVSDYLYQKGIRAEMVLDEGGEMTEEKTKEFGRPIAVIGVAEKGYASFELTVEKEGGHSSTPDKETAIDILAKALARLRSEEPPTKLTPQLKEFMQRIGPSSDKFINRMATSNLWLFSSIIVNVIAAEPEGNAMLHTTIVPTIISGGVKDNVVPGMAKAIVNSRILSGETSATVEAFIKKMIADDRVHIKKVGKYNSDPSAATATNSTAFARVEKALAQTVPEAIPTPYQMVGATDSRYYRKLSNGVVNFYPMTDAKGYHGINERMPLIDFQRGINFYSRVIEGAGLN